MCKMQMMASGEDELERGVGAGRLWNHRSEGSGLNTVIQEEKGRPFRKDCGDDKAPQKGTHQAEELVRVKTER